MAGRTLGWILGLEGAAIATLGALWLHDRTVAQQEARKLQQLQGQLTTTQHQLAQAQATGQQEASQIASLQGQLQQAQRQAQQEAQQITGLQGQLQTLQGQYAQAQASIQSLQGQLQQVQAQWQQAQATVGTDTRQIAQLQGQVASLQSQLSQAQQQAQQAQQQLQQLLATLPPQSVVQWSQSPSAFHAFPNIPTALVQFQVAIVYHGTQIPWPVQNVTSLIVCGLNEPCIQQINPGRNTFSLGANLDLGYTYQIQFICGTPQGEADGVLSLPITGSGSGTWRSP